MARKRQPFLGPIAEAMAGTHRMRLGYISKKAGNTYIRREIRPYEVSRASLWATDTLHGADQIHRFKLDRIRALYTLPGKTFKPQWPVKNPRAGLSTLQERIRKAREALRRQAQEALPQH